MSVESAIDVENNFKILGDMTGTITKSIGNGITDFFTSLIAFDLGAMVTSIQ